MGGRTKRVGTVLLIVATTGLVVITCGLLYDAARRSEGPRWPTITVAGHAVSVGGVLGAFVIAGAFCGLLAARRGEWAQPAPSARWGWYASGFAVLIVALCALGGDGLTGVLARGLPPALACGVGILATRHPGGRAGR